MAWTSVNPNNHTKTSALNSYGTLMGERFEGNLEDLMPKRLTLAFSGIPEALAEGAMTFPVYVFTALFYQHYGEVALIMPFVLWYTFHRAGLFFIGCLGTVQNPYKLCLYELLSASVGCLLLLFGSDSPWCCAVAAILVGLGTSGYSAMFRTSRDEMQDRGAVDLRGSMYAGYTVFLLAIVIVPYLGINDVRAMTYCLSFMVFGSLAFVLMLRRRNPYAGALVCKRNGLSKENLLYAVSILVFTFLVRFYRQTAGVWVVVLLPLAFVLMLFWGNKYKKEPYRPHSMRTLWYGAITNFLYVFPLFSYTSSGDTKVLGLVYFMIGLGSTISGPASAVAKKAMSPDRYETRCIVLAIASSFLMPLPGLYLIGTVLTSMFITMGGTESFNLYMQDEHIVREERRLVRSKFFSLGSVIEQMLLLVVVTLVSMLMGNDAVTGIAGYALHRRSDTNGRVYQLTLVACVLLHAVAGLTIMLQHRVAESRNAQA